MRPKVLVTAPIPKDGLTLLGRGSELVLLDNDEPKGYTELAPHLAEVEGILCLLSDSIDRQVMDSAPSLRVVANYAVGFDNIDVEEATRRGIAVTNTPDVLTEATADLAWALLLAAARRVVEGDRFTRAGRFRGWGPLLLLGGAVCGKTLGIVGAGRIGSAVARRASGFKMRVLYAELHERQGLERQTGATRVPLDVLIRESDYLSLHVPLTEETRHLIGREELGMMKRSAYLVNTSRGAVVEEAALIEALESGVIAGAGLDVYENEPEIPDRLLRLENVTLLPHLGSATVETRGEMAKMAARNLLTGLEGKRPPNIINPGVFD
jgi:glyoxylate reductase